MAASPLAAKGWEMMERTNDLADENLKLDIKAEDSLHIDSSKESEESSHTCSETVDAKDSSSNFKIKHSTRLTEDPLPCSEVRKEESSVFRKTATAVAGGTMVGVGLIMIPLPTPFGAVVAGSGMAVLGTEFPAAQRALDKTCSAVADVIERSVSKDDDEELDCEDVGKTNMSGGYSNEKMKELLEEKHKSTSNQGNATINIKKSVKQLGKKAVPVIRRIGEGIDKEALNGATESISKASKDTRDTVSSFAQSTQARFSKGASQLWRTVMVLDDDEDLMAPFKITPNSPKR